MEPQSSQHPTTERSIHDPTVPVVVVGGAPWNRFVNYSSVQTVRELGHRRDVLYVCSDSQAALPERVRGLLGQRPRRRLLRTLGDLEVRQVAPRVWVASLGGIASILPPSRPAIVRRYNLWRTRRVIRRWLAERGADECVLVMYWWFAADLVPRVPHVRAIYDVADEHAAYPGSSLKPALVRRLEGRLLDAVDHSMAVSPALVPPREGPGRRIVVAPSGFDGELFDELVGDDPTVPDYVVDPGRPVIASVGALGGRVDVDLVLEIIRRRPEWTFVFIGFDADGAVPGLRDLPNVRLPGGTPYAEGLRAMGGLDAAIIPFNHTDFTRGNSPLKVLDHLAQGIPVVTPDLPDFRALAEDVPGSVTLAEGVDAWLAALDAAVAEPADSPLRDARRDLIRRRSVRRRVTALLEGREPSYRDPVDRGADGGGSGGG
ncbi:MAG: hypothetical protein M0P31_06480 [Solirubrobacteraceae bacterium]|nr:hypothetical protein [Solirubrobacteraceae bacterium]